MVDIMEKAAFREHTVTRIGYIHVGETVFDQFYDCESQGLALNSKKRDALNLLQIAGILRAENTFDVIPFCQSIHLGAINMGFKLIPPEPSI